MTPSNLNSYIQITSTRNKKWIHCWIRYKWIQTITSKWKKITYAINSINHTHPFPKNNLTFKDNFSLAMYGGLQKTLLCKVKPNEGNYAWIMDVHPKVKAKSMSHIFAQPHPSCFTQHKNWGANIKESIYSVRKQQQM